MVRPFKFRKKSSHPLPLPPKSIFIIKLFSSHLRFIFPFKFAKAEEKVVILKKASPWAWTATEEKMPPRLILQCWDSDLIGKKIPPELQLLYADESDNDNRPYKFLNLQENLIDLLTPRIVF